MAGIPLVISVGFLFSCSSGTLIGTRVDNQLTDNFVHHQVGYNFLLNRVMSLWKPVQRMDCMDLGKDNFLIRFKEDFDKLLKGGPWFIGEHFLTIRVWKSNFKLTSARVSSSALWDRLLKLSIEYHNKEVLEEIGNAIGPVVKVDANTTMEARGRFSHICVEVDIDKPLIRTILIDKLVQQVVYEGITFMCFSCGRLGHMRNNYQYVNI